MATMELQIRPIKLKDVMYSKQCFNGHSLSLRETFSSQYFAMASQDIPGIPFLDEMNRNHKKCSYWKLLKHYCPCTVDHFHLRNHKKKFPHRSKSDLLLDNCNIKGVHEFTRACMKRIIPMSFWGDQNNFNHFSDHILKLISVGRRGEISLLHMMSFIKTKKMSWLTNSDPDERRNALMMSLDFLISRFVCPLIKSFFCVIETTFAKNKLFFFRKRVWHRLRHKAWYDFKKLCNLSWISEKKFTNLLEANKTLGYSKIYFLLKKTSVRSICSLSAKRNGKASINHHLKVLFLVLKYFRDTHPGSFGFSVKGREDVHQRFKNFILKIRDNNITGTPIYFLIADIQNCFDSIDPEKVFIIVSQLMEKESYNIFRYKRNVYKKNKVSHKFFESVHDFESIQSSKTGDIEVIGSYTISRNSLLAKLQSVLHFNVLKFGRQHYIQKSGISQGSIISSLLCDIFFGYLESQIQLSLTNDDLVLRQTDDYLIASMCKKSVAGIFENLISRVKEHGCGFNFSKSCASFRYAHPSLGRVKKTDSGFVNFSGISINCSTFEVLSDNSRYKGLEAKDVITMKLGRNPGLYIKKCILRQGIYPKFDAILFDKDINSMSVILKNILCIFCLCALKFHAFVMCLPKGQRVDKNTDFFLDIICSLPSALRKQAFLKLKNITSDADKKMTCEFSLPIEVVSCLCYAAFLFKMYKHRTVYGLIIKRIEELQKVPFCDLNFVRLCFHNVCLI